MCRRLSSLAAASLLSLEICTKSPQELLRRASVTLGSFLASCLAGAHFGCEIRIVANLPFHHHVLEKSSSATSVDTEIIVFAGWSPGASVS